MQLALVTLPRTVSAEAERSEVQTMDRPRTPQQIPRELERREFEVFACKCPDIVH
jgi:hypothetical protein